MCVNPQARTVLALVARAELGHLFPLSTGELFVARQAGLSQHLRIRVGGVVEHLEVAVELPAKKTLGQRRGVGTGVLARRKVEPLEALTEDTDVPVGVVDQTAEPGERRERVLAQLDHGIAMAAVEQALDSVDDLLHSPAPVVGLAVVNEVTGLDRDIDRAPEARQVQLVGAGRQLDAQALENALVQPRLLEQDGDERLPIELLQLRVECAPAAGAPAGSRGRPSRTPATPVPPPRSACRTRPRARKGRCRNTPPSPRRAAALPGSGASPARSQAARRPRT